MRYLKTTLAIFGAVGILVLAAIRRQRNVIRAGVGSAAVEAIGTRRRWTPLRRSRRRIMTSRLTQLQLIAFTLVTLPTAEDRARKAAQSLFDTAAVGILADSVRTPGP